MRPLRKRSPLPALARRLPRPAAKPREDRLDRLTKLVGVVSLTLPLSAALYGGVQLWLDARKHRDEMRLKSIEIATTLTNLKAEGKLTDESALFLLQTLNSLPIESQMKEVVQNSIAQLEEIPKLRRELAAEKGESLAREQALLLAQRTTDSLRQRERQLGAELAGARARLSSRPGQESAARALERELSRLKEELAASEARELQSVAAFTTAQAQIRGLTANLEKAKEVTGMAPSDPTKTQATKPAVEARPTISDAYFWLSPGDPRENMFRYFPNPPIREGDFLDIQGQNFGVEPGRAFLCGERNCLPLVVSTWSDTAVSGRAWDVRSLSSPEAGAYTVVVTSQTSGASEPARLWAEERRWKM